MNIHILIRNSCAATIFATILAGCSGGGSSAALPPAPPPGGTPSNALTTYSVYTGVVGNMSVVDVQPFGVAPTIGGVIPAKSAYVVYPDNSVQAVDALGNFDASKSQWAMQNVNILIANPNNEPVVDVFANDPSNPAPEEVSINAYAPGGALVIADRSRMDSVTGTSADLAHVVVFPASASLQDNRTRMFHAAGKDSNGAIVGLSKAAVAWSVARGAGCGAAAGRIKLVPGDASTAIYVPPGSGSATNLCPDEVVASIAIGSSTHSGSGNAFFYDPSTSAQLAGVLKTAAGQPAANAVINVYGGSAEVLKGGLLISTDGSGRFSRLVPTSRVLAPTATLTADKTKAAFTVLSPASVDPATAGAALRNQTWTMTAAPASVAPKPQPPYESLVRDASFYGNAARESFPFGAPNGSGQFAAGTVEFILAHPSANQTGTSTSGPYAGYSYRWDAAARVVTFTQPGSGNVRVLTVTLNAAQVNGQPCPSGAACFNYSRKIGTQLDTDGTWSQKLTGSSFTATYVRNEYNSSHQTAGSPVYSDVISSTQTVGTQNISLTDQRFNAASKSLGTLTASRAGGTGAVLYTYSATVHSLSYKSDGSTIAVDFALSNGIERGDYSGSFKFAITASPSTSDVGDAVNYTVLPPSATGNVANGTIDGVGLTGLVSGHAASFAINAAGKATLTKDASLGANVSTFYL